MSELALQLIRENKKTKETFLDLGKCSLKNELPKELLDCIWLEKLNLGNQYYEIDQNSWLDSKNQEWYNRFKGQELVILQSLTQLHTLHLISIQIQDYSFLQNLTQLKTLYISDNQIKDVSSLQNLTHIRTLYLNFSQIKNYSFLQNLTYLQVLHLSKNQIKEIDFLQNLTQLHTLNLSKNQIKEIDFLQNLTQLRTLDLSENQIKEIHPLQNLTQLQNLNLQSNRIQEINSLEKLTQLKNLDLQSNRIQNIKPLLFLIKNGLEVNLKASESNGVSLYNNPIINPPIEIIQQGRKAILRYFDRIEQQGKDFIFEAKLTLVGDGGSGKTTLQRRILDEKSQLPTGNESTRGIKVSDWQFNDSDGKTYTSHIWDFGGQDVYYPVHRFFLTENSVYILMASTRFPIHNFEYWIPTIYQFGGSSPIILVQTCDNGNQKDWTDIKPFYRIQEYNLKPIYKINLFSPDNWGLKNLKSFIQQQITELPHIGKAVPKSWVKVREQLIEKAKTENYISFDKFSEVCKKTDNKAFSKAIDVEDLGRFLHDVGIILWYYNKELLRNFVILKPEWAMNAVYKIIDDIIIQENNGIIYQADFNRVWEEESYQTKISELKLMLQVFKIAFPKRHQRQDYLLPARLQAILDKNRWTNHENSLRLEYQFDVMPRGIVNQLSAELSNKIVSDESVWSDAVILKQDNSIVQIIEEIRKEKIMIKARGNDARGLMVLIMNSLSNIINEYKGVVPLLRVPCNCEVCQALEKPTIFEYEELVDLLYKSRQTVTCNKSDTKLFISQLLYSVGLEHQYLTEEKLIPKNLENEKLTNINFSPNITVNPKININPHFEQSNTNNNTNIVNIKIDPSTSKELEEIKQLLLELEDEYSNDEALKPLLAKSYEEIHRLEDAPDKSAQKASVSKIEYWFKKAKDLKDVISIPVDLVEKTPKLLKLFGLWEILKQAINAVI